jgi:hypothetical protein
MKHECYSCHLKTVEKLIHKFKPTQEIAESFLEEAKELLVQNEKTSNPYFATYIHRLARQKLNNKHLYREEKEKANRVLLDNYLFWKELVNNSNNPFLAAAKLAVAGNIIDYGAHTAPKNIQEQIIRLFNTDFSIDKTKELFDKIKAAKSILYLGDNAGEIVFDKLLIELIEHENLTYVVRGIPVINDVTFDDIKQTSLDKLCKVISNGNDAPSTLLGLCSDEFLNTFNNADLIISKGQGNFEGLMNSRCNNLFFMLMAKCAPIADLLGVKAGDMLVTQ